MSDFAILIRQKRILKGLSQSQVAGILGTAQGVISNWERGVYVPRGEALPELGKVLDLDLEEMKRNLFHDYVGRIPEKDSLSDRVQALRIIDRDAVYAFLAFLESREN